MAQYSATTLDSVFLALSDPTRRAILSRLGKGPATVTQLAEPFEMALPSFLKHIHLLERTGWIRSRKDGRIRTCTIETRPFTTVETWLADQRAVWEGRTDRLEQFVTTSKTTARRRTR